MYKFLKRFTIALFIWIVFFSIVDKLRANEIYITQSGSNLDLDIVQDGENNSIGTSLTDTCLSGDGTTATLKQWNDNNTMSVCSTGSDNTVKVLQGSLSGNSGDNTVELTVTGNDNTVTLLQDRNDAGNDDPNADGYHETNVAITGDNNNVWQAQRNNGTWGSGPDGHESNIAIDGDYADIDVVQQADVKKTLNIDIDADYVTADVLQNGHGTHTINLDVDNSNSTFDLDQGYNPGSSSGHSMNISTSGTYSSDVTVSQQSNTPKSYSLSQTCVTVGGCAVSVTQN